MNQTFADRAISFFTSLDLKLPEFLQTEVLNPYKNPEAHRCIEMFFRKYFNDKRKRIFILGINPGRFGGGLTGISFTDPVALRENCGIENSLGKKKELSSEFVYKVIDSFGGAEKFYRHFFISAICPLGFMKENVNYNYYNDKKLQEAVTPFIKKTFHQQIEIGAMNEALIVVGAGQNKNFIERLNEEAGFFKEIISLDHPRFIMQYKRKRLEEYVSRYVSTLSNRTGKFAENN